MHLFLKNDDLRKKWTKFVQKHRPGFKPTKTLVLCSVHFTQESFPRRVDLADMSGDRRLEKEAFPTIDIVTQTEDQPAVTTDR